MRHHKDDIDQMDALNDHIAQVIASRLAAAEAVGLKPVPVRLCIDATVVNDCTVDIPFSQNNTFDAIARITQGDSLGKVDMRRAFNQIPHHPATAVFFRGGHGRWPRVVRQGAIR